jgi:predicted transposase/invertase (TIGR01784 family)
MRLFFIELPKFNPKKADAQDLMTVWLEFLTNPSHLSKTYLEIKEVGEAMDRLQYISADAQMREAAMLRQRAINDQRSEIAMARKMGIAAGLARGKAESRRETALVMLNKGLSFEMVSACTGLSIDEIKALTVGVMVVAPSG